MCPGIGRHSTSDGCYTQLDAYWDSGTAYVRAEFTSNGPYSCTGYLVRQENGTDRRVSDQYTVAPGQTAYTGYHWDGSDNGPGTNAFTPSW